MKHDPFSPSTAPGSSVPLPLFLVLGVLVAGCRSPDAPAPLSAEGVLSFAATHPERPRLRYRDGQVSALTHCAIRLENRLNPKIPPIYVNGAPVGFC